jgi:ribosomal protein S18 acetylase RimI-like enzyme
MPSFKIKDAGPADIVGLTALEAAAFAAERLSRRSFFRLVGAESAACRLVRLDGEIAAYSILLFRHGARVARLYSIAVDSRHRGRGLAEALIRDAERIAERRGSVTLRLEVREDNGAAIALYRRLGYRPIGRYANYYADDSDALRFEKTLAAGRRERSAEPDEDRSPRDSSNSSFYIGALYAAEPVTRFPAIGPIAEAAPLLHQ